jgi:putative nucleotidyltransferase with HDIG domain
LLVLSLASDIHIEEEEKILLREVVADIAFGLYSIELGEKDKLAEQKLQQSYRKLLETMEDTIYTIGKIAETRDPYTAGHQKNVSQIATFIAQEMKLPKDKIEGVRIASLVHDIGKISLPAEILNKPAKLSEIEYGLIKDHSQVGYDVLKSIKFSWPVARIVLQHHERLNGSGYPNNLKDDKILLEAKIIGVVDVVEAMSSHRPYRPALGIDAALEEITQKKGILYDPEVVDACIKLFKEKEFKL